MFCNQVLHQGQEVDDWNLLLYNAFTFFFQVNWRHNVCDVLKNELQ